MPALMACDPVTYDALKSVVLLRLKFSTGAVLDAFDVTLVVRFNFATS